MKNFVSIFAVVAAISFAACNSVDKELVGKMQNDLSEMEGMASTISDLGKNVNNLAEQISAAPEGMKTEENAEFKELMAMSTSVVQKHQATLAEYNDLMEKLKSLIEDYNAGKVKTEDVKKEYETIKNGFNGLSELAGRMNGLNEQMQAQFAKLSADWNAKAENATE